MKLCLCDSSNLKAFSLAKGSGIKKHTLCFSSEDSLLLGFLANKKGKLLGEFWFCWGIIKPGFSRFWEFQTSLVVELFI